MKFSATTSDVNTPTKPECRGAGRAAKLNTIANSTTDISRAADTTLQDGMNEIVDRNAMRATYSDMVSSGYSDTSWIECMAQAMQNESSVMLKMDEHGVPQNALTWSVIIEQHLRKKSHGYNAEIQLLRRERLTLLAGLTNSPIEQKLARVQERLYELTDDEIYNVHR